MKMTTMEKSNLRKGMKNIKMRKMTRNLRIRPMMKKKMKQKCRIMKRRNIKQTISMIKVLYRKRVMKLMISRNMRIRILRIKTSQILEKFKKGIMIKLIRTKTDY
jgi:hypothetical protein